MPINSEHPEDFDPLSVPTVTDLLLELDAKGPKTEEGKENEKRADYEKTSLGPYVEYFRKFVDGLLKDEKAQVKRERTVTDAMEF